MKEIYPRLLNSGGEEVLEMSWGIDTSSDVQIVTDDFISRVH